MDKRELTKKRLDELNSFHRWICHNYTLRDLKTDCNLEDVYDKELKSFKFKHWRFLWPILEEFRKVDFFDKELKPKIDEILEDSYQVFFNYIKLSGILEQSVINGTFTPEFMDNQRSFNDALVQKINDKIVDVRKILEEELLNM